MQFIESSVVFIFSPTSPRRQGETSPPCPVWAARYYLFRVDGLAQAGKDDGQGLRRIANHQDDETGKKGKGNEE
ncbi:hypothetical protein [Azotobacter beijerinckii]|uniref:hypothetical protein n=1 Tax=Azotobacter beijerinckii TaxID=170623 RepID=UPI001113DD26|nr:hypothetical protein [Azotobacter beijerinckii]